MLKKNLIILSDKKFNNKIELINFLSHLKNDSILNNDIYNNDVIEREKIMSTFIEFNTAIPHARSKYVKEPFLIYTKLKYPILWNDKDEKVNQVFMLGVPENNDNNDISNFHLKVLAELSKNLMREKFRHSLENAKTIDEIYSILKNIENNIKN